jgi:hypothetical protein
MQGIAMHVTNEWAIVLVSTFVRQYGSLSDPYPTLVMRIAVQEKTANGSEAGSRHRSM